MNLLEQINRKTRQEQNWIAHHALENHRVGKPCMQVTDLFKKYQDIILSGAKKSEKDYIKETFAKTELFDISNIEQTMKVEYMPTHVNGNLVCPFEEVTLPFECCFIKAYDDEEETNGLFIKEYSPEYITGAVFVISRRWGTYIQMTMPFTIDLDRLELIINSEDIKKQLVRLYGKAVEDAYMQYPSLEIIQFRDVAMIISLALKPLNRINEYATLVDCSKPEYYARKGKSTLKVNRIIYYLLDRKKYENRQYNIHPITKLEYSHAFAVKGHWRRINENTLGKNRQGVYNVKGHTWVKDYKKGEGELIKKVRVYGS